MRSESIRIRVTEEEKEALMAYAAKKKRTLTSILLELLGEILKKKKNPRR